MTRANVAVHLSHRRERITGVEEWRVAVERKPKLLVDIDGVVAEQASMIGIANEVSGGRTRLSLGDWKHYHLTDCPDARGEVLTADEWKEVLRRYSDPERIANLPLIPGAREVLPRLARRYDIAIVTTRRPELGAATRNWLSLWADFPFSLTFVPHRRKHNVLGIHLAVEDDYDQAVLFAGCGTPCFLMRWPWNDRRPEIDGVWWVSGWDDLEGRLAGRGK